MPIIKLQVLGKLGAAVRKPGAGLGYDTPCLEHRDDPGAMSRGVQLSV